MYLEVRALQRNLWGWNEGSLQEEFRKEREFYLYSGAEDWVLEKLRGGLG